MSSPRWEDGFLPEKLLPENVYSTPVATQAKSSDLVVYSRTAKQVVTIAWYVSRRKSTYNVSPYKYLGQ